MGRFRVRAGLCALVVATTATIPLLGTAETAGASTTTVTVGHENLAPNGPWASPAGSDTGTAGFVANGPGTPPVGSDSLALDVPAGQHRSVYDYQYGACANWPVGFPGCTAPASGWLKLSDITALGYSTYRVSADSAANALPSLNIEVDPTGTGAGYTTLVWERAYNGATTVDDTWETWDAFNGGAANWWSTASIPGAPSLTPVPWSTILANNPNAKVRYGLGPNVGTGPKFKGAVDGLTVGVSGNDTVFDFEATSTSRVIGADDTSLLPTPTTEWISNNDVNNGAGDVSYVTGPGTPPAGIGSARIATATSPDMSVLAYANIGNSATRFSQITDLRYSTYRSSADAGNLLAIALQLNVDYDKTDTTTSWQGRLVYEPYQTIGSGNVPANTWQTWNTLSGKWWMSTGAPKVGNVTVPAVCPQASPCTWAAFLAAYPKAGFNGGQPGAMFKAGSTWPGFVGNVDDFHMSIDDSASAFDFEPVCSTDCYVATTGSDTGTGTVADPFLTIQKGVDTVDVGGTVHVANGTYAAGATINKNLTLDGQSRAGTIVNGPNSGTGLAVGATSGVTISHLTVQHFNYGVTTTTGPISNFTVTHADIVDNVTHGIWSQAFGVNNYTVDDVNASRNNQAGGLAGRGIWMINGVKSGVTITNSTFDQNGLVGVDISDGTVTGATITNNTVTNSGDSGIGVLGAIGGSATLVASNTVTNNGRYGIEIKQSTGDGTDSGPNSVTVRDNTISRTVAATDARDYAGIALIRRSPVSPSPSAVSGIVVKSNSVSGYHRKPIGSTGDGFGIAAGGNGHVITQNTVTNNDVGVQVQAGNTANVQSTPYFDRDDSPLGGATVQRNAITGNGVGFRTLGSVTGTGTCNWWSSATGPGAPSGVGSGDGANTSLATAPWLLTSNLNGSCAPPGLSIGSVSLFELSNSSFPVANVPVTLPYAYGLPVSVQYTTQDGAGLSGAVAGLDYLATSGTVTLNPGQTTFNIPVTVIGSAPPPNALDEKDETFTVVLSNPTNATLSNTTGTVTIQNDDTPTLSVGTATVDTVEGNSGTHTVPVTVSLSNPSVVPITANYATSDGSALVTKDYLAASGSVTFSPGQITKTVNVTVKGDTALEDYEYFNFTISGPTAAATGPTVLGNATEKVQILNDEKPSLTGTAPSGKEGSVLQFGATLVQRYYQPITVNYTTGDLTALQPGDYTLASGSLLFPAGTNGTQTVGVQTKYDFTTEVAEAFNMTWTSPSIKVSPLVKKGTIKANNT